MTLGCLPAIYVLFVVALLISRPIFLCTRSSQCGIIISVDNLGFIAPRHLCIGFAGFPPSTPVLMRVTDGTVDAEQALLTLLSNLDLNHSPTDLPASPPPTPSPRPPPYSPNPRHMFPSAHPRTYTTHPSPTLYRFESPTTRGYTTEWYNFCLLPYAHLRQVAPRSIAGAATQGVARSHVQGVHHGIPKKKGHSKKAAYTVFCGKQCGVFRTW